MKDSEFPKLKRNIYFDPVQMANNSDLWESMKESYKSFEYNLKKTRFYLNYQIKHELNTFYPPSGKNLITLANPDFYPTLSITEFRNYEKEYNQYKRDYKKYEMLAKKKKISVSELFKVEYSDTKIYESSLSDDGTVINKEYYVDSDKQKYLDKFLTKYYPENEEYYVFATPDPLKPLGSTVFFRIIPIKYKVDKDDTVNREMVTNKNEVLNKFTDLLNYINYLIGHTKTFIVLNETYIRILQGEANPRIQPLVMAPSLLKVINGWCWFEPKVISEFITKTNSNITWITDDSGLIEGPNFKFEFGMNESGFINVSSKEIAKLSESQKRICIGAYAVPQGEISKDLLMIHEGKNLSNNLSPEKKLLEAKGKIDFIFNLKFGYKLFREYSKLTSNQYKVHRFISISEDGLCLLAKEIYKLLIEHINKVNLKKIYITSESINSIKLIENILNRLDLDGRKMTSVLVGLYELRLADAHVRPDDLSKSFELAGITLDKPYPLIGKDLISNVANCFNDISISINSMPDEFIQSRLLY